MTTQSFGIENLFGPTENTAGLDIDLGYEDCSVGGSATKVLKSLDQERLKVLQTYAEKGLLDSWHLAGYLYGLIEHLDTVDPKRKTGAVDITVEEIEKSELWLTTVSELEYFPTLIIVEDQELSIDAARPVWDIVHFDSSANTQLILDPPFVLMREHIAEPANPSSSFMKTIFAVIAEQEYLSSKNTDQ